MKITPPTIQNRAPHLQDGTYVIGRAPDCHIALSNMSVSGRHAQLHIQGDRAVLRDLGSRNGTIVDGRRLEPHVPAELSNGSSVAVGGVTLTIQSSAAKVEGRQVGAKRGQNIDVGPKKHWPGSDLSTPPEFVIRLVTTSLFPRSICWSAGVMLVALFLPWVSAWILHLNYLQLWQIASNFTRAFEFETSIWPILLPGLATIAAIVAAVTAFTSSHNSPALAVSAGALGTIGTLAFYITSASSVNVGMLGFGFYLFGLASVALLAVGGAGFWCRQRGYMNS